MDRFDYNQPNTRERIAARRKSRATRVGSAVRPGPRRAVGSWVASGRITSLLLLIAAVGGLLYIATAPRFTVRQIAVEGAQAMKPSAVAELTGAHGQSIWLVDTRQIVERLKRSAYIEQAQVSVALPDRLSITISERRPEVRWLSGGTLYLLDADGRVLDTEASAPVSNTLVIEDRSNRPLEPNDMVDADALKLGRLLSLRLPAELGLRPARIGWSLDTRMFITTADNRMIIFGRSDNLDDKLSVLGTLLNDHTAFTLLDLRPVTPFYRNDVPGAPAPTEVPETTQ
ncbi:MAG TPA: FtsQ-type POTRA domain-containing protein [Roseiflexaceae bacterium]|nr:FtsQ-type POTRA domain-containing protein [Roseiflexaceae bacterium]